MPKVSDAHVEARRTQILEASCKCFSRKGFHQTTMRDICAEAGLSAGAVYGYFKSKDELIEALAELGRRNTSALIESALGEGTAPASLSQLLRTVVGLFNTDEGREGTRLDVRLWGEGLHTPQIRKLFQEAFEDSSRPLIRVIRDGQKRGEISNELDPESAARVCIALVLGLQVQRALDSAGDLAGCTDVISSLLHGTFNTEEQET
jgi:AcrR family transcriptional regulator